MAKVKQDARRGGSRRISRTLAFDALAACLGLAATLALVAAGAAAM